VAGVESFEVQALSSAPPAAVFALLADGPSWQRWAGPLIRRATWDREGDPAPGGVGAVRKLGAPPLFSREEIVAYDPPHHLAYTMLSGQPVRDYRADVRLVPDGAGTRIEWAATFRPRIPGTGRLMRWYLGAIVGGFARRLAAYAAAHA
jgi:uncharacterized protein YndB with AHSA1/START domain